MPLHAQIICIGGNFALAALMFIGALGQLSHGVMPDVLLFTAIAGGLAYSGWVHLKFRKFLQDEAARRR